MCNVKMCKLNKTECTGTPCMYTAADKPENYRQLYFKKEQIETTSKIDPSGSAAGHGSVTETQVVTRRDMINNIRAKCRACDCPTMMISNNYCPNCGVKIEWQI